MALNGIAGADAKDAKALENFVKANASEVYEVSHLGQSAGKEYVVNAKDTQIKVNDLYIIINRESGGKHTLFYDLGKDGVIDSFAFCPGTLNKYEKAFLEADAKSSTLDTDIKFSGMVNPYKKKQQLTENYTDRAIVQTFPSDKSAKIYDFKEGEVRKCTKDFYSTLQQTYTDVLKMILNPKKEKAK